MRMQLLPGGLAMPELTGIMRGTGAKMKVDILGDHLVFRGAVKAKVPFVEVDAEARGTLLVLTYKEQLMDFASGSKAVRFASLINRG
jgi:hypothetical protein